MNPQEELKEMAKIFAQNNPRWNGFALDITHYAVRAQFGKVLTVEEYKEFLFYLTKHTFDFVTVKDALENMPHWLKEMYNRKD